MMVTYRVMLSYEIPLRIDCMDWILLIYLWDIMALLRGYCPVVVSRGRCACLYAIRGIVNSARHDPMMYPVGYCPVETDYQILEKDQIISPSL
jgi:hypothetical protein